MKTGDTDLFRNLNSAEVLSVLAGFALVAVDENRTITGFTTESEPLLGLKAGDVLGQDLSVLPSALSQFLSDCLAGRASSTDTSLDLRLPGRGVTNLRVKTTLLLGKNGHSGLIAMLRDATARKKVEQHLRRLNTLASIGTLSASMAHEIKNALVAGKTFVELLLEKHPEDELSEIVRRETNRIDGIVGQMLRFSAPGKGGFSNVSLHDALDHSLRLIAPQLQSKALTLNRRFDAGADSVEGDSYQLQQAFVNLLLNSIEAMRAEGVLTVRTEDVLKSDPLTKKTVANGAASYMKVVIADSGDGISPDDLAHIFEPFFTTKGDGTGLGLPITRGIIEEHGGLITVESEPKKGAQFIILFPLLKS